MLLVAIGAGSLEPCLSVIGADTFDASDPAQAPWIAKYFSVFYSCM